MSKEPNRNEYFKVYNKQSRVRISLNFSKNLDRDILEAIEKEDPKNTQAAIKSILRREINSRLA